MRQQIVRSAEESGPVLAVASALCLEAGLGNRFSAMVDSLSAMGVSVLWTNWPDDPGDLDFIARENPSALLIAVSDASAAEIISRLKAGRRTHKLPLVAVTAANCDAAMITAALESGANCFVSIETEPGSLAAMLKALIGQNMAGSNWAGSNSMGPTPDAADTKRYLQSPDCEGAPDEVARLIEALSQANEMIRVLSGQRDRTARVLRESEDRFLKTFHVTPQIMAINRLDGRFLTVNEAFTRATGYSADEVRGKHSTELNLWVDRDVRDLVVKMAGERKPMKDIETRLRARNGDTRTLLLSVEPIEIDGQAANLIVADDMTERKSAHDALRESEDRYQELCENANDMIFIHDLQGNFLSINKAAEVLTGYTRTEGLQLNIAQILPPRYLDLSLQMIKRQLAGDQVPAFELEVRAKDGTLIAIEVNSRVLRQRGIPVAIQGIARDISERKRFQQHLMQSEKLAALGQLVSGVAHELNNPLTSIIGHAQLMIRAAADVEVEKRLQIIDEEGQRARKVVQNLLSFARQQKPTRELVDINHLIERTLELRSYEWDMGKIDLRLVLGQIPQIVADGSQLQQVFFNIVTNAEQAMKDSRSGKTLSVKTEARTIDNHKWVVITITDDGPGIPPEHFGKLFDPFFTTKEVGKGTGLGLSISYGIIKEHKGNIRVESSPGCGAAFFIELPV